MYHRIGNHIYTNDQIIYINRIFHDIEANYYNTKHQPLFQLENSEWIKLIQNAIQVLNSMPKPKIYLDFGCGTGFVSKILAQNIKPVDRLICLDLSIQMLHRAKECMKDNKAQKPNIDYISSSIPPFGNNSIHLIAINSVLHHLPEPEIMLNIFSKIIKPGGFLLIAHEPNRRYYNNHVIKLIAYIRNQLRDTINHLGKRTSVPHKENTQNYEDFAAKYINDVGIFPWQINASEVVKIANIQVPHEAKPDQNRKGFDVHELTNWLDNFILVKDDTKLYLGSQNSKNPFVRVTDNILRNIFPKDGRLLSAVWQKQCT